MDKTLKQIADELGLSKQAVRKRVDKLPNSCYYVGANRTIFITPKGYKILTEEVPTAPTKVDTKLVDTLTKQLEEKDRQIESLLKSLDQAQQLHAIAESKLKALEDLQSTAAANSDNTKSNFWNFFKK